MTVQKLFRLIAVIPFLAIGALAQNSVLQWNSAALQGVRDSKIGLMWQPNLSNSIPVPIAYQEWQFSGSTTAQTPGNWGAPAGNGAPVGPLTIANSTFPNSDYPAWSNVSTSSCQ
jgi:hypothetical protein